MKDFPLFVGENCSVFSQYYDNSTNYPNVKDCRIPSLMALKNYKNRGVVIAAADKASCGADWGYIEIAVRRSIDNGDNFDDILTVFSPPVRKYPYDREAYSSAFAIDPLLIETNDGKVIMLVDFYPESKGLHAPQFLERGSGYSFTDKGLALKLYTGKTKLDGVFVRKGKEFTLHSDGYVYDNNGRKTNYYVPKNHSPENAFSTWGDMYYCVGDAPQYLNVCPPALPENAEGEDIYVGNIFLSKGKEIFSYNKPAAVKKNPVYGDDGKLLCIETSPAPLRAPMVSYIYKFESVDGGKTFSQPEDITPFYKTDEDGIFLGVGPGIGITLKSGAFDGRILAPCYILNKALVIISDDNGKTWHRNAGVFCENIDECQLVEMPDGKVFCFGRPKGGGLIPLSVSEDGGENFSPLKSIEPHIPQCQRSVVSVPSDFVLPDGLKNDGRYILLATPTGHNGNDSTRTDGKVYFGRIDGKDISWIKTYDITDKHKYSSFERYSDFYAYSCLSVLEDNKIGLLYEAYPSGYITYVKFELK